MRILSRFSSFNPNTCRSDCLAFPNCQYIRVLTNLELVQNCTGKGFNILQHCNNFLQLDQELCVYLSSLQEKRKHFGFSFLLQIKVLGLPVRDTVDSVCPKLRMFCCGSKCIWNHLLKCRWFSFPLIQA